MLYSEGNLGNLWCGSHGTLDPTLLLKPRICDQKSKRGASVTLQKELMSFRSQLLIIIAARNSQTSWWIFQSQQSFCWNGFPKEQKNFSHKVLHIYQGQSPIKFFQALARVHMRKSKWWLERYSMALMSLSGFTNFSLNQLYVWKMLHFADRIWQIVI